MKKTFIAIAIYLGCLSSQAQSIIQEQKQFYDRFKIITEKGWDTLQERLSQKQFEIVPKNVQLRSSGCRLENKRVYGWHPYWNGSSLHNNYQWNLLSDLCYFDYSVNPTTGANSNTSFAWSTSTAITAAKNNGVKISFCATLFSNHSTFLSSTTAKNIFINNTIALLKMRGGSGVCVDFEGMPVSQKSNFVSFMQDLSKKIHDSIPSGEVALAVYSVDWSGVFDISKLKDVVDLFIVMGYDYYYGGSAKAGPTDPLYPFETSYNYGISKSISYYLYGGIPANKLLMAVPYYGRQYQTSGSSIPSSNSGGASNSSALLYKTVQSNSSGNYRLSNKRWDANSFSPYYLFQSGSLWYQCFINDSSSIKKRYDIINQRGLGGIALWALGYDDGYTELWNAIGDRFTSCYNQPLADSLYDMGGPNRNYNDKEIYSYTIAPKGVQTVSVKFSQLDLESGFDSVFLYDGASERDALLGRYSGNILPNGISSTGSSLTLRFKSDGATNKSGYKLYYSTKLSDTIPPTTRVNNSDWITGNFNANFIDQDTGSGVRFRFYSIEEYDTTNNSWIGKSSKGFLNDVFNSSSILQNWIKQSGNWTVDNGVLIQSDQLGVNTNLYTSLVQDANQILYHWTQSINGSGTNRRGGLHFMCSNSIGNGRGNSYLVMARVDGGGKLQIYKSVNDMVFLNADISYPFLSNKEYDFKVIYNKLIGEVAVFINDKLTGRWIDTLPLISGNYISMRSGECVMNIDNLEVLKSRALNNLPIAVGIANLNDINKQNASLSLPSARIKSYVVDSMDLFSEEWIQNLNVDYTAPASVYMVRDGKTITDIATTTQTAQLAANWNSAMDFNSGIRRYWYAIGTSLGAADVLDWSDNGNDILAQRTSLLLYVGTTYYFSVKAENNAGLMGPIVSSNGQKLLATYITEASKIKNPPVLASNSGIHFSNLKDFRVFPNPTNSIIDIEYTLDKPSEVDLIIYDSQGNQISKLLDQRQQEVGGYNYRYTFNTLMPKGIYYLILSANLEMCLFKVCFN